MTKKNQYQARLENQKAQLERHGNFAEVVIRTTPEGTDMINFARLWEHILVMGDRSTRGYMAKKSRENFDKTRQDFEDSIEFMVKKLQDSIKRHDIDLAGSNFISRVAQRYEIVERKKGAPAPKPEAKKADKAEAVDKKEAATKEEKPEKEAKATKTAKKEAAETKPAKEKADKSAGALAENVEGF